MTVHHRLLSLATEAPYLDFMELQDQLLYLVVGCGCLMESHIAEEKVQLRSEEHHDSRCRGDPF